MNITEKFLTVNPYSRPKKAINKIKAIVIHWVANPKSSAEGNRNYFENRKYGKTNYGSAHFIVEGMKTLQCLPYNEMAYHVGSATYTASCLRNLGSYPNNNTLGIEMTHPDSTGKPDAVTYLSTVKLTAFLLKKYGLTEKDVWTHKQVVGWKNCHLYYVNNPSQWVKFIADVAKELNGKTVTIPTPKAIKPDDIVLVEAYGHGDKGNGVKKLQEDLNTLGYDCGKADGIFGNATDKAVEKFQKANKLFVDGLAGLNTLAVIKKELATKTAKKSIIPYPGTVIKKGSTGNNVGKIQKVVGVKVDNDFGPATEKAIKAYQKKRDLKVDGQVGKITWNKMFN